MLDVASEDEASLFYCQLMDGWILYASLMQIVLDVFDVKVGIQAREKLTRWEVFIE